jgi:hypothetical protein
MNGKTVAYWVTTGMFALAMLGSGIGDLMLPEGMREALLEHLALPAWFPPVLGAWKVLGVAALLAPGAGRLKEWAYAGFFFNLTGAMAAHLAVGDGLGSLGAPAVLLGLGVASYLLRPASRALGAPLGSLGSTAWPGTAQRA